MYPALVTALVLADEARALARTLVKSRAADWVEILPVGAAWVGWLDLDPEAVDIDRALLLIFTSDGRAETVASLLEEASSATMQLALPAHMELDVVARKFELV